MRAAMHGRAHARRVRGLQPHGRLLARPAAEVTHPGLECRGSIFLRKVKTKYYLKKLNALIISYPVAV